MEEIRETNAYKDAVADLIASGQGQGAVIDHLGTQTASADQLNNIEDTLWAQREEQIAQREAAQKAEQDKKDAERAAREARIYPTDGLDLSRFQSDLERVGLEQRILRLEEEIPATEDPEARHALMDDLATREFQLDQLDLDLGGVTDDEIPELKDQLAMKVERLELDAEKLVAEGFAEDSVTVRKARELVQEALTEVASLKRKLDYRDEIARLNQRHEKEAVEAVQAAYIADVEKEIRMAEEQNADPWRLLELQARLSKPASVLEDYEQRKAEALLAVKQDFTKGILGRFKADVEARYGDEARAAQGFRDAAPTDNADETIQQEIGGQGGMVRSSALLEAGQTYGDVFRR